MSDKSASKKIADFKPSVIDLRNIISKLASDSANVAWTSHAQKRMVERDICDLDALRVLRIGEIEGDIVAGNNPGEWKCKVVSPVRGGRDIGVVSVVAHRQRIIVKTVEWEDIS